MKTKVNPKKGNIKSIAKKRLPAKKLTLTRQELKELIKEVVKKQEQKKNKPVRPSLERCMLLLKWYTSPINPPEKAQHCLIDNLQNS